MITLGKNSCSRSQSWIILFSWDFPGSLWFTGWCGSQVLDCYSCAYKYWHLKYMFVCSCVHPHDGDLLSQSVPGAGATLVNGTVPDLRYFSCNSGWACVCSVAQSCPTLCDPMDHSLPGSSVHGIPQARILEWVAISSSRGSSWPRDRTQVSCGLCFGR